MSIRIGNLVEVIMGPHEGVTGRVVAVNHCRASIVRLEIEDNANMDERTIRESGVITDLHVNNLMFVPWPAEVDAKIEVRKQHYLDKLPASTPHYAIEPTIRVFSPSVFGLVGGWDT